MTKLLDKLILNKHTSGKRLSYYISRKDDKIKIIVRNCRKSEIINTITINLQKMNIFQKLILNFIFNDLELSSSTPKVKKSRIYEELSKYHFFKLPIGEIGMRFYRNRIRIFNRIKILEIENIDENFSKTDLNFLSYFLTHIKFIK